MDREIVNGAYFGVRVCPVHSIIYLYVGSVNESVRSDRDKSRRVVPPEDRVFVEVSEDGQQQKRG